MPPITQLLWFVILATLCSEINMKSITSNITSIMINTSTEANTKYDDIDDKRDEHNDNVFAKLLYPLLLVFGIGFIVSIIFLCIYGVAPLAFCTSCQSSIMNRLRRWRRRRNIVADADVPVRMQAVNEIVIIDGENVDANPMPNIN